MTDGSEGAIMTTNACFEVRFNKPQHYVTTIFKGKLSYDSILASFDQVVNSADYLAGMGRIWDLTAADLSGLNEEAIWMIAGYSSVFPSGINNVKVALISAKETDAELIRLFLSYSQGAKTKVKFFASFAEAEQWITDKRS